MKKVLFPSLFGLLLTTVASNYLSAQTTALLQPTQLDPKPIEISLIAPEPDRAVNALPLNAISAKANRTFNSSYKGATNQQWYKQGENKFLNADHIFR